MNNILFPREDLKTKVVIHTHIKQPLSQWTTMGYNIHRTTMGYNIHSTPLQLLVQEMLKHTEQEQITQIHPTQNLVYAK